MRSCWGRILRRISNKTYADKVKSPNIDFHAISASTSGCAPLHPLGGAAVALGPAPAPRSHQLAQLRNLGLELDDGVAIRVDKQSAQLAGQP